MNEKRDSFGSKIGAILVAAGSAVGLGSIWRFPYIAGENGGSAFILMYMLSMLCVGIPVMLAEFAIGTRTRKSPVKAYDELSPRWKWLGYNSIVVSILISGFYYIVAGWALHYFIVSLDGSLYTDADFHATFERFCSSWQEPLYTYLFIALTHIIVVMGVQKGLERTSKVMMPALLVMLVGMAVRSSMMEGAAEGYEFLFKPDFSKAFTFNTLICAIGQAFFSLSIGLGCMIAYSSYFKQGTNLTKTAFSVTAMTFIVAILSGIVIFPAVFSVEGLEPTAGPTLIFETLPFVFRDMPMPQLWSAVFFLLISMAALTSTISFHEVLTQYLQENHSMERRKAATTVSLASAGVASLCLAVPMLFDAFDQITADYLMPIGGLFTAIFAGWIFSRATLKEQITNAGTLRARMFPMLVFALKWLCPILLTASFIYNLVF